MILAFVTLGGLNAAGYAWLSGRARTAIAQPADPPAGGTVPAEFSWPVGSRSWPQSIRRAATMYYRRRLAEVHAADYAPVRARGGSIAGRGTRGPGW